MTATINLHSFYTDMTTAELEQAYVDCLTIQNTRASMGETASVSVAADIKEIEAELDRRAYG